MIKFVSNSMRRWQPISKTLKIIHGYIIFHSCIYFLFSRHLSQCENHKMTNAFTKYLALLIIRDSFLLYFRLLLLVEMKNHSKCGSELNGAADGVGKVTQGLYVACSDLCIQLLEKPDLTERNKPGEVNYTGRASRSSHRRLKCDVINAGCRCRRRCLPFSHSVSRFSLSH